MRGENCTQLFVMNCTLTAQRSHFDLFLIMGNDVLR